MSFEAYKTRNLQDFVPFTRLGTVGTELLKCYKSLTFRQLEGFLIWELTLFKSQISNLSLFLKVPPHLFFIYINI